MCTRGMMPVSSAPALCLFFVNSCAEIRHDADSLQHSNLTLATSPPVLYACCVRINSMAAIDNRTLDYFTNILTMIALG